MPVSSPEKEFCDPLAFSRAAFAEPDHLSFTVVYVMLDVTITFNGAGLAGKDLF